MLSQKKDPFINLVNERSGGVETAPAEIPKPRGPMLYISDVKLPITDKDQDQVITAQVKIKPRRITTTIEGKDIRVSYDLELTGIKFLS